MAGYGIIDGFLGAGAAGHLLTQIIAAGEGFTASRVRGEGQQIRSSLRLPGRVGVDLDGFTRAVVSRFEELAALAGTPLFDIYHAERSIVAHRDGDYYRTHIDTRTQAADDAPGSIRVLSCVYYLHAEPRRFSGGELLLHRVGVGDPVSIEPVHDRLAVFPSFLPHEVRPIASSSNRFEDSRFSINCWLHKARHTG